MILNIELRNGIFLYASGISQFFHASTFYGPPLQNNYQTMKVLTINALMIFFRTRTRGGGELDDQLSYCCAAPPFVVHHYGWNGATLCVRKENADEEEEEEEGKSHG